MVGIVAYGAYVPVYRLTKETSGWGSPVEKAVRNFDEDSLTMGVAAARDCLQNMDCGEIDGVFFATTTPPYMEKQAASILAAACDLRSDVFATDIGGSLRAGTNAMRMAFDAVKAGTMKQALVVAADSREGAPKSALDLSFGDGAAAFIIGKTGVIATISESYSVADHMMDTWRGEGEQFVGQSEDRLAYDKGINQILPPAVAAFLKKEKLTVKDITTAAFYAPTAKQHQEVGKLMGLDLKTQAANTFFGQVGNTGTAMTLMILAGALENAKAGNNILVANYSDGADVFLVKVTEEIGKLSPRRAMSKHIAAKKIVPNYFEYLSKWRKLVAAEIPRRPAAMAPSPASRRREADQILRLHGVKCKVCGTIQYPPQRICTKCHSLDQYEKIKFANQKAKIFTFSKDIIAGTPDVWLVITIVDFEQGGRGRFMMTDRDLEKDAVIGLTVEMSFRNLGTVNGIKNYYWKTVPARENMIPKGGA
jgi:hydroxymethylglutaryl-CoA synthase